MARLRIPAGILKTFQARELARISTELTTGYIQITTRSNIQLRQIEPRNAPALLSRIQGIGLHTRGAGADNVRNITTNPTAGLDPCELIDTLPFCQELAQVIINNREFYDLPRKFNIAFDGGGLISSLEETNDIGARAVKIVKTSGEIKPGIYFRLGIGGATGHKSFANDLGVLVPPQQIIKVLTAMLRVYIAKGDRTNRKRARLKHLLEKWTFPQYLEATEELLGFKLLRASLDDSGESRSTLEATPLRTEVPHPHVGVFPQKQGGLSLVKSHPSNYFDSAISLKTTARVNFALHRGRVSLFQTCPTRMLKRSKKRFSRPDSTGARTIFAVVWLPVLATPTANSQLPTPRNTHVSSRITL
jgi:ferredoxin-nitrite reductase